MSNHIVINNAIRLGSQLASAVATLRSAQQQISAVQSIMAQCASGNDYSDVEAQFGITPNGSTGVNSSGYSVQYQLNTVNTALTNSDVSAAINQFLAQLG